MKIAMILAASILATVIARAQGSGGVTGPSSPNAANPTTDFGFPPFEVTKTIKLRMVAVPKDGMILVSEENGSKHLVKLDKKVRIRADKGTEFAGRKKILLEDLQGGMLLKITYRASDSVALELRILKNTPKG